MTLKLSENPKICYPDNALTTNNTKDQLWYAAYTKPRHEKALAWTLMQRKVSYFLPLIKTKQPSIKRVRYTLTPLFTSYIFFKADNDERIRALKTNRIVQTIHVENQDLLVKEMNVIYQAITNRNVNEYLNKIKTGQKVRIVAGPLIGLEGILLEQKNERSIIIEVESINKTIRVEIESDRVEPIS
jgi:transcription antitermination factor NusG